MSTAYVWMRYSWLSNGSDIIGVYSSPEAAKAAGFVEDKWNELAAYTVDAPAEKGWVPEQPEAHGEAK